MTVGNGPTYNSGGRLAIPRKAIRYRRPTYWQPLEQPLDTIVPENYPGAGDFNAIYDATLHP